MMVLVDKKDADRQVVKLEWPAPAGNSRLFACI